MGIVKFISKVTQLLQLKDFEEKKSDKKSIKSLLKKLEQRQSKLQKKLKKDTSKNEREDTEEELEIIELQMQKGKKILRELKSRE